MDASDPEALRSVDAATCHAAIVAIGEDFEASVLVVTALKEAGVKRVIGRARTPRQARILAAVGAAQVLELEAEMGRRLGLSLASEGS
jgi:trk system potassium uptake protein TrkA